MSDIKDSRSRDCPRCLGITTAKIYGAGHDFRKACEILCDDHLQDYLEACRNTYRKGTLEQWSENFLEVFDERIKWIELCQATRKPEPPNKARLRSSIAGDSKVPFKRPRVDPVDPKGKEKTQVIDLTSDEELTEETPEEALDRFRKKGYTFSE